MLKALQELTGATDLKDDRVSHYLAAWALSFPLAKGQFNKALQYVNTASSPHTTSEACKVALEAKTASLLPPIAMCELVLNLCAPKS